MDRAATAVRNSNHAESAWTDEKHLHFLNSMEASFVRTMFENCDRHLRLDRQLPDTSDSTLDLKKKHTPNTTTNKKKKHVNPAAADIIGSRSRSNFDITANKRSARRHSYQPYTSSQDQVVPQMGNRRGDKDENGPPNVHVAVTPAN